MPSPTQIKVPQLLRLIGTPDAPVIIDVCIDDDFNAHPYLIPGAFRHSFKSIEELVPKLIDQRVVVVCHKGLKLSEGAAAMLRSHAIRAESLEGGVVGWRESGAVMIPARKIPTSSDTEESLWVTRHRPKIDRLACPWLIRRFVDPQAKFLFVSPSEVMNVAERFNATPFDIEDVFWSHRGGQCSFDTMVEEFELDIDALKKLAVIVRAADTNQHQLAPEAAGLLAASLGLSRMYKDDLAQVEAGMLLYDAFYRWARDAADETHDWPTPTPS